MTSFLDYYKMILDKVSFNTQLFSKEYQKATRSLSADEIKTLNHWLESKGLSNSLQYKNRKGDNAVLKLENRFMQSA